MIVNAAINNGSLTLRPHKWRKGYMTADTLTDREILKFLEFPASFPAETIDEILPKASQLGFDIREILPEEGN